MPWQFMDLRGFAGLRLKPFEAGADKRQDIECLFGDLQQFPRFSADEIRVIGLFQQVGGDGLQRQNAERVPVPPVWQG